jgi:MFS superfamily sulfate permease-like transporter
VLRSSPFISFLFATTGHGLIGHCCRASNRWKACRLSPLLFDSLTRSELKSNKELVGQGVANIVAGLFGALTVLVDLTVAVAEGIFIANSIMIDKMSRMQTKAVQTISTANEVDDPAADLSDHERDMLRQVRGRVLLFQLNGAMIFYIKQVFHLGLSAALAIENAVGALQ